MQSQTSGVAQQVVACLLFHLGSFDPCYVSTNNVVFP